MLLHDFSELKKKPQFVRKDSHCYHYSIPEGGGMVT